MTSSTNATRPDTSELLYALESATNLLLEAQRLSHYTEPVVIEALRCARSANPPLVAWLARVLAAAEVES